MPRSPEPTSKPPPSEEEIAVLLDTLEHESSGLIDD